MARCTRRGILVAAGLFWLTLAVPAVTDDDAKPVVRLVIDFGDGVQTHFTRLPWKAGLTVVDALAEAKKHSRGINYVQRGRGASAMITQIDGLANQGSGKNWLFSVNMKESDVGAGACELQRGDTILWEFKDYDYN